MRSPASLDNAGTQFIRVALEDGSALTVSGAFHSPLMEPAGPGFGLSVVLAAASNRWSRVIRRPQQELCA